MDFISIASVLVLMGASQSAYTAEAARRDMGNIRLAETSLLVCERGSDEAKKAMIARFEPRVKALNERFRHNFGNAMPTEYKTSVLNGSCNSRRRYDRDLDFLITQVERRAASLPDAPSASATPAAVTPSKPGE